MLSTEQFDFAIIGAGAAGLHLALAMIDEKALSEKKILVIDKSLKTTNDRTWCYWEKAGGKWDHIAHKIWDKGYFISNSTTKLLDMQPYQYKMLRSVDFYLNAKNKINEASNFYWVNEEVNSVKSGDPVEIDCGEKTYFAKHVFDSRVDLKIFEADKSSTKIQQHFRGWVVETEHDFFNQEEFVMMDFRLKLGESASFTYVLPSSSRKALVEFTLFTEHLIDSQGYDSMLKQYCDEILKLKNYSVAEIENGIIPMTDFPFQRLNTSKITKIGTAGGWVKPSSGYSFKNCERFSAIIIKNILKGAIPSKGIATARHRKYDRIFLEVLKNRNELGERIFTDMYLKNPASRIFKFLDEQSSIAEDLKIISSFESAPFFEALIGTIRKKGFAF